MPGPGAAGHRASPSQRCRTVGKFPCKPAWNELISVSYETALTVSRVAASATKICSAVVYCIQGVLQVFGQPRAERP